MSKRASPKFRIERERMVAGQTVPLFRVIVRIQRRDGSVYWMTIQSGLLWDSADNLLGSLRLSEEAKQA